jgi:hypothetical protein
VETALTTTDCNIPLDFGNRLFNRLRDELTDVTAVKSKVERLTPLARAFPETRFCKGCVLPIVSEAANQFLFERFCASSSEVFKALRCEGFENLEAFYPITATRTGFCGSPWNRDRQPLSKCGQRAGAGANPDFCIWYSARGQLRLAGETKYKASRRTSRAAVRAVLEDLRYYLAIKSCSHSDWAHDFGFGVAYCAGGEQPRKAELLLDYWDSDKVLIAYFSAG